MNKKYIPFARSIRQLKFLLKKLNTTTDTNSDEYNNLSNKIQVVVGRVSGSMNFRQLKRYVGLSLFSILLQTQLLNAQTNVFSPPILNPFGLNASMLNNETTLHKFSDLDDDGDLDLLVIDAGSKCYNNYYEQDSSILYYLENIGDVNIPNYQLDTTIVTPVFFASHYDIHFLDIDNDGDLDLLLSGDGNLWSCESYLGGYVYPTNYYIENIGNATHPELQFIHYPEFFYPYLSFIKVNNESPIAFGKGELVDIDNDGDLDYLGTTATNIISTYAEFNGVYFEDLSISNDTLGCSNNNLNVEIHNSILDVPINYDSITYSTSVYCGNLAAYNPQWLNDYNTSDQINMFDFDMDSKLDIIRGNDASSNDTLKIYHQINQSDGNTVSFDVDELIGWLIEPSNNLAKSFKDFDNDGDIDVFMMAENGDSYYSENLTISPVTNTINNATIHITAYPNPASSYVVIDFNNDENMHCMIKILDIQGKAVKTLHTNSDHLKIDLKTLPRGIYTIAFKLENSYSYRKFIVQ